MLLACSIKWFWKINFIKLGGVDFLQNWDISLHTLTFSFSQVGIVEGVSANKLIVSILYSDNFLLHLSINEIVADDPLVFWSFDWGVSCRWDFNKCWVLGYCYLQAFLLHSSVVYCPLNISRDVPQRVPASCWSEKFWMHLLLFLLHGFVLVLETLVGLSVQNHIFHFHSLALAWLR